MTIHSPHGPERYLSVDTEATEQLTEAIARHAHGGPGVEPQTAAMFQAVIETDGLNPLLNDVATYMAIREIGTDPAVSAFRTNLIAYFTSRYEEDGKTFSDATLLTPEDWRRNMEMLRDDLVYSQSEAAIVLHEATLFRDAATPARERARGPELIAQLIKDRFPEGVRCLDIGSSVGAVALQLVYKDEFPLAFRNVSIEHFDSPKIFEDVTDKANNILARPGIFTDIVCVDKFPVYRTHKQEFDEANLRFALSGLRPSERNDRAAFSDLLSLLNKKRRQSPEFDSQSGVVFHEGNLLEAKDFADFSDAYPEPFDMILMSYMTQELAPQDQLRMHKIASRLLAPNGVILYTHQAYLHPWNLIQPASIDHVRHYKRYATESYRSKMHIVDNLNEVTGLQEAMSSYDNRWHTVRIGDHIGKLIVNGESVPIADLIQNG